MAKKKKSSKKKHNGASIGFEENLWLAADELLNGEIFHTLREAKVLINRWRDHYNIMSQRNTAALT